MKLRNGDITIKEILMYPEAKQLMQRELPEFMNNPMLMGMARNMTLKQVVGHSRGRVPKEKIDRLLEQLKTIN